MRAPVAAALASLAALSVAATAGASAVERIRVADASRPETQGFPPNVYLTLESPPDYAAQSPGLWAGPPFWAAGKPDQRGTASIEWTVVFRDRTLDVARTATAAATSGWPEDQRGNLSVPLIVNGRTAGTLPAFFVLTSAPGNERAKFEATAAIPLGPGVQAVVRLLMRAPAADASPWGEYLVFGSFLASTWNRGQALVALSRIRVEGNLAPKTVSIRRTPGRLIVHGKVVDAFVNPLVGVPVRLERQVGASWRVVRTAHTGRDGRYRLSAPGRGRYRTSVRNAGLTVTSATITLR